MRDIKFRGKRFGAGEWVYGDLWHGVINDNDWAHISDDLNEYNVNPATVGQFTGLKDKNGVEIYEGDWTESAWGYSGLVDMEGIIYAKVEGTISDDIVVCSNIHDTPEPWKEESDV